METTQFTKVILKPNRDRSLLRNHPWVFSGAISQIEGEPGPGDTVQVCDSSGKTLGFGAYSPFSQIRVRMWSIGLGYIPIEEIIRSRVARAVGLRKTLREQISSDAYRLIHAESDQLPGVIADQYGGVVVVQLLTTGAYHWRDLILEAIGLETECSCLVEKSDADVLGLEGLLPVVRVVSGALPEELWITEHGLNYLVKPLEGQKTGFYMDQRENHHLVQQFSGGKRVLDCFSYTGGFGLNTLKGGADSVEMVDSSESALALAKINLLKNGLAEDKAIFTCDNVFDYLRKLRDRAETYDLVILDPPKLAPTHAQVEKAARAYKDMNLLAMKLLNPGGILFSFSCSGGVGMDLFKKIIADAAQDAGRDVQFLHQLHQSADHPIGAAFPEGEYLKGLVCSVTQGV